MSSLPAIGICAYNGWNWPNSTRTEAFSVRPVWDSAQRTITVSNFTLTLSCVIQAVPTDAIVQDAVSRLTQPAGGLRYTGRGVGDVKINLPGGATDCAWGPKPREITTKMMGGGNATRLTWTVDFAIPTCGDARYSGPMEFNYSTTVTVDKSGYTQRVYKGHIVIAQTRQNVTNRVVTKSADEWRELINPPLLDGFRRVPGTFELSEDKCRLDFTIHDEQMPPNAPPDGVIECDADHSYTLAGPGRLFQWTATLSANYELALDTPPDAAVRAFFLMAEDRIDQLRPGGLLGRIGQRFSSSPSMCIIPLNITIADTKIFDKTTVHISMQYTVSGASLRTIMNSGGLWRPVPGANWNTWATSLKVPLSSRGWAQVRFTPGEDTIIDLCGRLPAPKKDNRTAPKKPKPKPKFVVANFASLFPPASVPPK